MEKLTAGQKRDALITGCALGASAFLLSVGVADAGIATPLGIVAGMSGALFAVSPWKNRLGDRLRVMPALPVDNAQTIYENRTPMIEETPIVNRQPQRTPTLQRRAPVAAGRAINHVRQQVMRDADALQSELIRLEISAKINVRRCVPGGQQLAFYGIDLLGKTKASDIAKVTTELERAISQARRQRTRLRFDDLLLRFETEHPNKQPLRWSANIMASVKPHEMIAGASYHDGEQITTVTFKTPHILLAGETGSGKSVLLRNMITSLAYGTSPDDLRMVLIDLKNEDLLPYRALPHVDTFAGIPSDAVSAIKALVEEKNKRVADPNRKPFRIVLIVDELAQLVTIQDAIKNLGDIMSIGRGKLINVIAATQQPTEDGGMGSMMKANVPLRLIGAVSSGQSYTATRRKNAQADMLPGDGSFLYIAGPDMYRFQSYLLDEDNEDEAIRAICKRWGAQSSTTTGIDRGSTRVRDDFLPVVEAVVVEEPVDNIDEYVAALLPYTGENLSKNAICKLAFGKPFAGSTFCAKVNDALGRIEASTTPVVEAVVEDRTVISLGEFRQRMAS